MKPLIDKIKALSCPEPNTGCWLWTGSTFRLGYGRINLNYKIRSAHRVSWEAHMGKIPVGLHVLHRCDCPPCVNPEHLFLGTHLDNMKDKCRKNRSPSFAGDRNPAAKLSNEQVIEVRRRLAAGEKGRHIAKSLNVSESTVSGIKVGENWKDTK